MKIYNKTSPSAKIKISILVLTYNHFKYIYDALNSAWKNSKNLQCEFIIYNDASSDKTDEIIVKFISERPELEIVYIRAEERRYGNTNDAFVYNDIFNYVRGEFIAYCDGDDVWGDGKLLNQYNFMSGNPETSMTFGPSEIINEYNECIGIRNQLGKRKEIYVKPVELMLSGGGLFHTSNIMIRSSSLIPLPAWFNEHYTGDYPLGLLASLCGSVVYLPNAWGKYRKLSTSMSHKHLNTSRSYRAKRAINIYKRNMSFFRYLNEFGCIDKVLLDKAASREAYRYLSRLAESGYLLQSVKRIINRTVKLNINDNLRFVGKIIKVIHNLLKLKIMA